MIATIFFLWFAGTLCSRLWLAEGGAGRLATTAYGGALIFAAGLLISLALNFTAADTAGSIAPAATQALSALSSDFFFPMLAGGAVLYLATAVATLRTAALPRWLGWVTLALGVVSMTPVGWVPFLLLGLWTLVVSVLLYRGQAPVVAREPRTAQPTSAPAV